MGAGSRKNGRGERGEGGDGVGEKNERTEVDPARI